MWPQTQAITGLLTDLYHVDAAYVSWHSGQNGSATFDLYTRSAPFRGAYLLAAGLEPALAFVRDLRYGEDDLATWPASSPTTRPFSTICAAAASPARSWPCRRPR